MDSECFKRVDQQARKFDCLESIDDDHKIMYSHYKGMYTVADRDFVYFRGKKTLDEGKKMIYATFSVDTHDVDVPRGVVRAFIYFSGWFIEIIDKPDEKEIKASGYKGGEGPWVRLTYAGKLVYIALCSFQIPLRSLRSQGLDSDICCQLHEYVIIHFI